MDRKSLFNGAFFLLLATFLYLAVRVLWPSCGALLAAAILAVIFYPAHQFLGREIPSPRLCAFLSTLLVFVFFLVPVGLLAWTAVAQSDAVIPIVEPILEGLGPWARSVPSHLLAWASDHFPGLAEQMSVPLGTLQINFSDWISRSLIRLPELGTEVAKLAVHLVGGLFLTVVALYFFFLDGPSLVRSASELLPLRDEIKSRIQEKVTQMVVGVARGSVLTSVAQGIVGTVGFLILRTPSAFLLGFVTMLVSVIPFVGTALIWAPLSFYYFWTGSTTKGLFLLMWGLLVTGSIDNFLRPWLIGAKENVPFLWLFFSIVGGLQVFGLFGLLIGPLVMAILIILLDVYHHAYLFASDSHHPGSRKSDGSA